MANSDQILRFMLPEAGVRGVIVHLRESAQRILDRPEYSAPARQILGEMTAAAAMLADHVKIDGRLSVQMKTQGDLRTVFAEATAAGTLRGIVQMAEDAAPLASADLTLQEEPRYLAITVENRGMGAREPQRYQGLVEVTSPQLATNLEEYFDRSEQLPTRVLLSAGDDHAAGILLQKLPGVDDDTDGWNRVETLFETLTAGELASVAPEIILNRLFHQEGLELVSDHPLHFACSCSRERAAEMLASIGPSDGETATTAAERTVKCEFWGESYHFNEADIRALLTGPLAEHSPSKHLH